MGKPNMKNQSQEGKQNEKKLYTTYLGVEGSRDLMLIVMEDGSRKP